jgi:hypothetical protein
MVGDLIPGEAFRALFFQNDAQTVDSSVAIMVAIESFTTFDTMDHKMMQGIGVSKREGLGTTASHHSRHL